MKMLVTNLGPDTNKIWLCDGMFRRDVTTMLTVAADGSATGPVSNGQIFQALLLGNLAYGGRVFRSGGVADVWGVDIASLKTNVTLDISANAAEMLKDVVSAGLASGATKQILEDAAFVGAQKAERE